MPVVKEDFAFVVSKEVTELEMTETIEKSAGELLESVRLFDVYEGSNIAEGKKSMAFSLRFRAPDRTLNSEEIAKTSRSNRLGYREATSGVPESIGICAYAYNWHMDTVVIGASGYAGGNYFV